MLEVSWYKLSYDQGTLYASSSQSFIKSFQNYPDLKGIKTNLYKCFLPQAWTIGNYKCITGFVHPEGVYDDPDGGTLREKIYSKLRAHFQFINEKNLFPIAHTQTFSLNIYSNEHTQYFYSISNLFDPITIDQSIEANSSEPVQGIKDKENNWNIKGHQDRVIRVAVNELKLFAKLYDEEGTQPKKSRLPLLHSKQLINVLKALESNDRIRDVFDIYYSAMLDETGQQKERTIIRDTSFPQSLVNLFYSGPHIGVSNPLFKTPRRRCESKGDYDSINLGIMDMNFEYIPRSNYKLNCSFEQYLNKIQTTQWGEKYINHYRIIWRRRLNTSQERTLISTIIPPQVSYINTINGFAVRDIKVVPFISAYFSSIVYDWFIKSTGKADLYEHACNLPIVKGKFENELMLRGLMLNCINKYYEYLWEECWKESFKNDSWGKYDLRLNNYYFNNLSSGLKSTFGIKNDFVRRQVLIEIDVLVSMALGLTLDDLKTMYRIQFPVLQMYEYDTWYDKNGRMIFTVNRGYNGIKLDRKEWESVRSMQSGFVEKNYLDDTMPGGPVERTIVYEAPFDRCDREKDYEEVWKNFEERFKSR